MQLANSFLQNTTPKWSLLQRLVLAYRALTIKNTKISLKLSNGCILDLASNTLVVPDDLNLFVDGNCQIECSKSLILRSGVGSDENTQQRLGYKVYINTSEKQIKKETTQ